MESDFTSASNKELAMPASNYCNRMELIGFKGMMASLFLGQLWGLFGKPRAIEYEGFAYQIKDKKTGVIFQAYSAGSGPAYCFSESDKASARDVVQRLENELAKIQPEDCEIEIETDFGTTVIGCKDGKNYERPKRRRIERSG